MNILRPIILYLNLTKTIIKLSKQPSEADLASNQYKTRRQQQNEESIYPGKVKHLNQELRNTTPSKNNTTTETGIARILKL